ncbi:hypothetical protein ABID22_003570 [Pontibacter aydingkolensis]|uniref:Uncharacterized protein n=1 Tax=Pontibacter aydingkolensis TaxID=1911536 RepID=A0ABS7CZD9_9BACT|nr:hypothetical protein [Pontibacter aydingkolensis]MBW7468882.1 hypothetical protein [Pontibacter aydingkolensis]
MTNKNKFIVTTTSGETAELTNATTLKSNNLYPFGRHNYAVYETPEGKFVRGLNKGEREVMLTHFELLDEATARNYKHDYTREDD